MKAPSTSKPVVCVAGPFPPRIGGMTVQAVKLADRLAEEGLEVIRLQSFPTAPAWLRFTQRIRGVRTIIRGVQYLRSMFRIVPQCTVVHHLVGSGPSFFMHSVPLLLVCARWKKRLIFNYRSGNAGETFLRHWGWLAVPLMHRADCIAVPSAFLQRVFREHGINSITLPNIGDTELFPFHQRRQFRPRLIAARHLTSIYGMEYVVRAFALVQSKYPDAVLGLAGSGGDEPALRRLCQDLGLRNVRFHGSVPNPRMPDLYLDYDIAVNASVMDNFPGALLEAALSGLAIVTSGAGGIPDMIQHGSTGLLVPMRDPGALAAAVLNVLQDQNAAHSRTVAARQWAERFSWAHVYRELLACYQLPPSQDRGEAISAPGVLPSTEDVAA